VGAYTYKILTAHNALPHKIMGDSNDKTRKRDIFKNTLNKATTKLGFSSQAEPSHMFDAMASTVVTNSISAVAPAVSEAHKNAYYPTPPAWPHVDNPDEVHWRGEIDSRASGRKSKANFDRMGGGSNQPDDKKDEKKKKVEDSTTGPKDNGKNKKTKK